MARQGGAQAVEGIFIQRELILHDLPVHAVARHPRLGGPAVAAHLQADQTLALPELFLRKLPPIPLGFPTQGQHRESGG